MRSSSLPSQDASLTSYPQGFASWQIPNSHFVLLPPQQMGFSAAGSVVHGWATLAKVQAFCGCSSVDSTLKNPLASMTSLVPLALR